MCEILEDPGINKTNCSEDTERESESRDRDNKKRENDAVATCCGHLGEVWPDTPVLLLYCMQEYTTTEIVEHYFDFMLLNIVYIYIQRERENDQNILQ